MTRRDPSRTRTWSTLLGPFVVSAIAGAAGPALPADLLQAAVREYRAAMDCSDRGERVERFRRAELLFEQLITGETGAGASPARGIRNAELFVNQGNAALGAERLGAAILAYRRALRIDPDQDRGRQNLRHARSLLPDWVPRPAGDRWLDTSLAWINRLSEAERGAAAGIAFFTAAALVAAAIRWRNTLLRNLAILPVAVWLALLLTLILDQRRAAAQEAVVIVPEVIARSADSAHAPPRFGQPVPGGAEVQIIERRESWVQVRLADGRDAWLPANAIEPVDLPR